MKKSKFGKQFSVLGLVLGILLCVYAFSLIFPLLWTFMTSLKSNFVYTIEPIWFPKEITFENYSNAWHYFYVTVVTPTSKLTYYFDDMMLNSIVYSLGCAFCATFVPFLVAYLTARYNYKFSKIINTAVIVIMTIPVVGNQPSEIQIMKSLGLFDQVWGVFIMQSHFLGMYYLVFYASFKNIPNDFVEAAEIDGASPARIMFTIMMPMAKNAFGAVFLLRFIFYWNEYQIALVYLPSYPTISKGLLNFDRSTINQIANNPSKMAGCMMLCIPILIVFLT